MNEDNKKQQYNKDSVANTLLMALAVSLVCSVFVASTVTLLKPIQKQNQLLLSGNQKIAQLIADINPELSLETIATQLEVKMLDLESGEFTDAIDPANYQQNEADKDPELSIMIPDKYDIAGLGQRSKYAKIALLIKNKHYQYIVLPIYGAGMWSTLYGYLLLERDANTIAGLKFYQHGETPGIGDKIDNPDWLRKWRGKRIYENGVSVIQITKNKTPGKTEFEVDGITGATMTTRGVNDLLQYWLGEHGYQPFLKKISSQEQ